MFWKKKNNRQISNLVIDPAALVRFSHPLLIQLVLGIGIIKLLTWQISDQIVRYVQSNGSGEHDIAFMKLTIERATTYSILGMLAMSGATYILFMIYSHRILGPTVALKKHLLEMQRGNFKPRIKLRKNDELKSVAEELNKLTEDLERKLSPSPQAEN